jgi:hypothetical protein
MSMQNSVSPPTPFHIHHVPSVGAKPARLPPHPLPPSHQKIPVPNQLSRALSKNNLCLSSTLFTVNLKIDVVRAVRGRKVLLSVVMEEDEVVEMGEVSSSQEEVLELEDDVEVVEEERANGVSVREAFDVWGGIGEGHGGLYLRIVMGWGDMLIDLDGCWYLKKRD